MNKNTKTLIMGTIFTLVVVLVMGGLTYAFFTAEVIGNTNANEEVIETADLRLVFTDTLEISMEEALPGQSITKTFTLENIGTASVDYIVNIIDVVNTFVGGELVYTLTNDKGLNIENTPLPKEDKELVTMTIAPKEVQTYTLTVTFLETGSDQNANQGAIFKGKLYINSTEEYTAVNGLGIVALYVDNQKVNKLEDEKYYMLESYQCDNGEKVTWSILQNNLTIESLKQDTKCKIYFKVATLTDIIKSLDIAQSDETLNFEYSSNGVYGCSWNSNSWTGCKTDTTKITKGLYYTSDPLDTENGERVYYYRGEVENNYVIFGGYCWRIVRTLEDGGVRLRYGGVPDENGACPKTGTAVHTETNVAYNSAQNNAKYVGYTYDDGSGEQTDSNIKTKVEAWYETNIWKDGQNTSVTDLIKDAVYCNDRTEPKTTNSFGAYERLHYSKSPKNPSYKCEREEDRYTQSEENGNGLLKYPVGLLTADEMTYAGARQGANNTTWYLYTSENYWGMSPDRFYGTYSSVWYVTSAGFTRDYSVTTAYAVVPVVSLKLEAEVSEGNGEFDSPYVIMIN